MSAYFVDLRSDTLTRPTPAMLEAMMSAEVGDDVWGDDPTVAALEARSAQLFGKAAAVFCPSGTMTNQIAIRVACVPGDEVICSVDAHIYNYEGGGIAANAGASARFPRAEDRGRFTAAAAAALVHGDDVHLARTRMIAVEDTVNRGGGAIWDAAELDALGELCAQRGLHFHLDGARVMNRLVATGEDPAAYGKRFDSISLCLSKGLGAPVGSVLVGDADFIHRARRVRKLMGGGMRQAGYLAAAGLFALEHHVDRLADDHARAKRLAEALEGSAFAREVVPPETNIVLFRPRTPGTAAQVAASLAERGVRCGDMGADLVRFVLHLDVDAAAVELAADVLQTAQGV